MDSFQPGIIWALSYLVYYSCEWWHLKYASLSTYDSIHRRITHTHNHTHTQTHTTELAKKHRIAIISVTVQHSTTSLFLFLLCLPKLAKNKSYITCSRLYTTFFYTFDVLHTCTVAHTYEGSHTIRHEIHKTEASYDERILTWVYLNCCSTSLIVVWQSRHTKDPLTSSGWTGWVRTTWPVIRTNDPIKEVDRPRTLHQTHQTVES